MKEDRLNNEEWLNTLKDSMQEYSATPPAKGWSNISSAMDAKLIRGRVIRVLGSISAIAAIVLLFLFVPFNNSSEIPTNKNNIKLVDADIKEGANEQGTKLANKSVYDGDNDGVVNSVENRDLVADNTTVDNGDAKKYTATNNALVANNVSLSNKDVVSSKDIAVSKASKTKISVADNVTSVDNNSESVNSSLATNSEEVTTSTTSDLTWEEYLADDNENNKKSRQKRGRLRNLLALQVGNGGFNGGNQGNSIQQERVGYSNEQQIISFAKPVLSGRYNNIEQPYNLSSVSSLNSYVSDEELLNGGTKSVGRTYNHTQPISFSLLAGKELSHRFSIESGVVYTLLNSTVGVNYSNNEVKQQLHYVGIPLRVNWNFVNSNNFLAYTGVGGIVERSVYAKLDNKKIDVNSLVVSAGVSVGAQYSFMDNIGLFLEPSLLYYFGFGNKDYVAITDNGVKIKSVRSEYPLGFAINAGFRFSF